MDKECEKSANGEHEVNLEKLTYKCHVGLHAALFDCVCLHCGALGVITVDGSDVDWGQQ